MSIRQYIKKEKKFIPLILFFMLLGCLVALWSNAWDKETDKSILSASLFVSFLSLAGTLYLTIEIAIESRMFNQNKLLSDYTTRFSNDANIRKVIDWLIAISDKDKNEVITKFYPQKTKDDTERAIEKPTLYEKERFMRFFTELNIQIKNKQLKEEDVRELFSFYALMFSRVEHLDNDVFDYKKDCAGFVDFVDLMKKNKEQINN